ncbi:MAG TPA: MFS transporter [Chloroflexota bacterium]|nr:MFS transporter [Chloroflexota bacterium]
MASVGSASVVSEARTEPRVGATLAMLAAAGFLVSLDRAIFAPLLPALARDLDATISAVGLAVTAYVLPYGGFQLVFGPVADRTGKVRVVRLALALFAVGTGLCGLATSLALLDALRFLTGAAAAAVIPLSLAFIGDAVPYERRQAAIANFMSATSLGNALSTAVGGVVGQVLSWRALFAFYGVGALVVTAAMVRLASDPPKAPDAPLPPGGWTATWSRYARVLAVDRARFLYCVVLLEGVVVQGAFTYLGAYLEARFALAYLWIGLLLACYGIGTLATSRVVRRVRARIGEPGLVLIGGVLIGGGYLAVSPTPVWWLVALPVLVMGIGFTLFHTTLQTAATELVPELRGTAVSLFGFSLFLGAGAGTAGLGVLLDRAGFTALLLVSGGLMLGLTAVTWRHWRARAAGRV